MSLKHSFVITISNNITEKEGVNYLIENFDGFFKVTKEIKKEILKQLNLGTNFLQTFDLIYIPGLINKKIESTDIEVHLDDILLIELKTTKKYLPENPKGFFFGATENEFKFAEILGDKYKFCFVCLHEKSMSYKMLSLSELELIIRNKRIQFQINL